MKKLILIAALTILSGTTSAAEICSKDWVLARGDNYRHYAILCADGAHPYTQRGVLITESGTIVDAVDMRPIVGLEKVVASERMRLLQQREATLFARAAQLPEGQEKWEAINASEQTEVLLIGLAQCAAGLRTECAI